MINLFCIMLLGDGEISNIERVDSQFADKTLRGKADINQQTRGFFREPRWPSGLRRWFANATPRETGFRIPPLPRAEFGRLKLE